MPGNLYGHPLIEDLLKLPLPLGFLALGLGASTSGLTEKYDGNNVAHSVPQFPSLSPALFRKCRHI
jgi:hypothetical protein